MIEFIEKGWRASYCLKTALYNSCFGMDIFAWFLACLVFYWNSKCRLCGAMLTKKIKWKSDCSFVDLNNVWLCHARFSRPLSASYKSTFPSMALWIPEADNVCNWMNARWPYVMRYCNLFNLFLISIAVSFNFLCCHVCCCIKKNL